jgi:hypothetical protein
MDNFLIDLTAEDDATLREALVIVFRHNAPGRKATHWLELSDAKKRKTLVLMWHEEEREGVEIQRFPVPLDADGAFEMVYRWLEAADYGHQPDHDGDNGHGFRIYCGACGHVENLTYSIVGVSPAWAMYGK